MLSVGKLLQPKLWLIYQSGWSSNGFKSRSEGASATQSGMTTLSVQRQYQGTKENAVETEILYKAKLHTST